jgi:hypothetical protein
MEGHRHERAALVLASYVIGFTTAFILYANITSNNETSIISVPTTEVNTASVINAAKPTAESTNILPIEIVSPQTVMYTAGRLEVTKGENTVLLSFNPTVAGIDVDTADLTQGFHFGEVTYLMSPDNKFVFFCERQDVTNSACLGFVYDIDAETIYPVVKNGAPVLIGAASLETTQFTNSGLEIGTNYSANSLAPWVLIDTVKTLDLQ